MSRKEAEQRRGFNPEAVPKDRAKGVSLFFDDLLDAKIREFNPLYAEAEGALLGKFRIRRYHRQTPELFVPEQVFTATDAIGFSYGVT